MPFSRIHSKFKKGTVYFVTDAVKPLHLLGNIYFNGFDIYGMLQICVNILPPFSKHNRRRNGGKIENTHSIINFSELISKVCINYASVFEGQHTVISLQQVLIKGVGNYNAGQVVQIQDCIGDLECGLGIQCCGCFIHE